MQAHKNQWERKRRTKREDEGEKKDGGYEKYASHAKSINRP